MCLGGKPCVPRRPQRVESVLQCPDLSLLFALFAAVQFDRLIQPQRRLEVPRGDLGAGQECGQRRQIGILEIADLLTRQGHGDLKAVPAQRQHRDIQLALRIYPILQDGDHLRHQPLRVHDVVGHMNGVDETHPAAQVLAQPDSLEHDKRDAKRDHDENEHDLPNEIPHKLVVPSLRPPGDVGSSTGSAVLQ